MGIDWLWTGWPAVEAIATSAAVAVALGLAFLPKFLDWLHRPRLRIAIENSPPDCHATDMTGISQVRQARVYYMRLRVHNDGGIAASDVEVLLEEAQTRDTEGRFRTRPEFLPLNLVWSHVRTQYLPRIMPGLYHHCDLGWVPRPEDRSIVQLARPPFAIANDQTLLVLDLFVQPNTGSHLLPPGTHRLRVAVAAANAKVVRRRITIEVTGRWPSDEATLPREDVLVRA